jgi:hypothetical protein
MATPIASPPALLAALKSDNPTLSLSLGFDFFQVLSGTVQTPALISRDGHASVYLLSPNTTMKVTSALPEGVTLPTSDKFVGSLRANSTALAFATMIGVANDKVKILIANGVWKKADQRFENGPNEAWLLIVPPGSYVISLPDSPAPATATTPWALYVSIGLAAVGAAGAMLWLILRRRKSTSSNVQ